MNKFRELNWETGVFSGGVSLTKPFKDYKQCSFRFRDNVCFLNLKRAQFPRQKNFRVCKLHCPGEGLDPRPFEIPRIATDAKNCLALGVCWPTDY